MADYVIPDGPFTKAYAKLAASGWKLNLQSAHRPGPKVTGNNSKTKFTCAKCALQNSWGKPDLDTYCGPCLKSKLEAAGIDPATIDEVRMRPAIVNASSQPYEINLSAQKRGRPNGSKNKPKAAAVVALQSYDQNKRKRGRPKGSKNKPKVAA
jgi:hypothetical protein